MAIRDLTTIIQDAINYLVSKRPNIATAPGSVNRDVVIDTPAQEFNRLYIELLRTQKLQTVAYAKDLSVQELDDLAANYAMVRLTGTQATGYVTFQIRVFSTGSSTINIPVGTVLSTDGSDGTAQVSFTTTASATFQPSFAATYFNPLTGFYERTATVVAENIGAASNVAAGTITQFVSSVAGVDSVVNTVAITGGADVESNVSFAARIQNKLSGNNVGTASGIISLMKENANVVDALVVTPNDVEMIRNEFGGEVDVYVVGEVLTTESYIATYIAAGGQTFVLPKQPVRDVDTVTGIAGATPYTFVENVDFNFVQDPTILFNGSTRLKNAIRFNIGGTNPDDSSNFTVSYIINSLIPDLQSALDADDKHIVTADLLVKEATRIAVGVVADVVVFPGYSPSTVVTNIQTAVSEHIDALGLGDSIDRSDIVGVIEEVAGIDQVDLSTLQLSADTVPIPASQQRLSIAKTAYPRTGVLTITAI